MAVNEVFGGPLSVSDRVLAGMESESKVSGYHADHVGPAIMGGFVLIRSFDPLELIRLKFPLEKDLLFVLAEAWVASVVKGDLEGLGKAVSSDKIVEPRRAPLIPGMEGMKKAAKWLGLLGAPSVDCGGGSTAVAVTDDVRLGKKWLRRLWRVGT
ncbi:homoserine kinase [Actinidia rufa]|uniref:Homoserine kinase n=1 Tax=Actinidia rufa TaxID=165716 RepID=A0A7J0FR29_9ERIC|nr:homoserine kinase [Actinidia rufa]